MTDELSQHSGDDVPRGISRRDALKKGAMIGSAAFLIPVVSTISMSEASAQTPSGGTPRRPPRRLPWWWFFHR